VLDTNMPKNTNNVNKIWTFLQTTGELMKVILQTRPVH
jgi:hypothetical protein